MKRTINGTTSFFVYDLGWRLLCDYNSSGGRIYRYVNGPASNEIVSRTDSSNVVVYYHTDGLGSITKLTSSTGAVLEQYSYDAFGKTTIQNASGTTIATSAYGNRFMYTGAEFVAPTGLYNNRNRFYSPSLGRFLQPDLIGHAGDSYNIYRYCGNNPINAIDPTGKDTQISITLNTNAGGGEFGGQATINGMSYNVTASISGNGQALNVSVGDPTTGTSIDGSVSNQGADEGSAESSGSDDASGSEQTQSPSEGYPNTPDPFLDLLGKIWNLPNTLLGFIAGGIEFIAGEMLGTDPQVNFGNNSIQFTNLPWGEGSGGALTLGNVQLYSGTADPNSLTTTYASTPDNPQYGITGQHEEAHTFQSEALGIAFLPVYFAASGFVNWRSDSNPFEHAADQYGRGDGSFWPWQ